jgi:hypothetical protein
MSGLVKSAASPKVHRREREHFLREQKLRPQKAGLSKVCGCCQRELQRRQI